MPLDSRTQLAEHLLTVVFQLTSREQYELAKQLLTTVQMIIQTEPQKDVVTVLSEIRDALNQNGLPCPWPIKGWSNPNWTKFRDMPFDTGLSARRDNTHIVWAICIDGAGAGVKFIPYRHSDKGKDGDPNRIRTELHMPENPEILVPKIKGVFSTLGFDVLDVIFTTYKSSETYELVYSVTTLCPSFLKT